MEGQIAGAVGRGVPRTLGGIQGLSSAIATHANDARRNKKRCLELNNRVEEAVQDINTALSVDPALADEEFFKTLVDVLIAAQDHIKKSQKQWKVSSYFKAEKQKEAFSSLNNKLDQAKDDLLSHIQTKIMIHVVKRRQQSTVALQPGSSPAVQTSSPLDVAIESLLENSENPTEEDVMTLITGKTRAQLQEAEKERGLRFEKATTEDENELLEMFPNVSRLSKEAEEGAQLLTENTSHLEQIIYRFTAAGMPLQSWECHPHEFKILKDRSKMEIHLGTGRSTLVFAGKWRGEKCAIKKFSSDTRETTFVREVRFIHGMNHENVCRVECACKGEYHFFMIMERLGQNLAIKISEATLSQAQVLDYAIGIAKGIEYLHSFKPPVIHRDINPTNIVFDSKDVPKLIDFGIARAFDVEHSSTGRLGDETIRYMAPERFAEGTVATPAFDVYSFGVLLWHMITRATPLGKCRQPHEIAKYLEEAESIALPMPHGTPPIFKDIVRLCSSKDPAQRPNIKDVRRTLFQFSRTNRYNLRTLNVPSPETQPSLSSPSPPPPKKIPVVQMARVIRPFTTTKATELSLTPGDIITVCQWDPDGWSTGECNDRVGHFPSNFTTLIP